MKGISGIIGSVVVIILLLIAISLILVTMNYAYGIEQTEVKTIMSQLSQPHVTQVSPNSVVTSGRLLASYIIYPDGRVAPLNESVSGVKSFQSYLNGNPWAVVVFSNGQWVNVTNVQIPSSNGGNSVSGVPFLTLDDPYPINATSIPEVINLLRNGTRFDVPITINNTISHAFGFGTIPAVPVTSESGWLNFTLYYCEQAGQPQNISFAIIVPNASGPIEVIQFYYDPSGYAGYGVQQVIIQTQSGMTSAPSGYIEFFVLPNSFYPYTFFCNTLDYNFTEPTTSNMQFVRVALHFTPGEPAKMYLWIGSKTSSGFSWYQLSLPTSEAPVGSAATVYIQCCPSVAYANYPDVTNAWPVNLYSLAPSGKATSAGDWFPGNYPNSYYYPPSTIYLEPLVPMLGSEIMIIPSYEHICSSYCIYGSVVIFNVSYTI